MMMMTDDGNGHDDCKHIKNDNDDDDDNDDDVCRPGETVELPCDASDADKFVRVWMKVGLSSQ